MIDADRHDQGLPSSSVACINGAAPQRLRRVRETAVEPGTVVGRELRSCGRPCLDDPVAVGALPELVGMQGESRLEWERVEGGDPVVGIVGAGKPVVRPTPLQPRVGLFARDLSSPCGGAAQAIDPCDGKQNRFRRIS